MHELSVCRSLLREVRRVADANDAAEVTAIVVSVGPLSGVEPALLSHAFASARIGTLAENAVLEVESAPLVLWCRTCEAESEASAHALVCGTCGTWRVDLKSGNAMMLKRVELVPAETDAAAVAG